MMVSVMKIIMSVPKKMQLDHPTPSGRREYATDGHKGVGRPPPDSSVVTPGLPHVHRKRTSTECT